MNEKFRAVLVDTTIFVVAFGAYLGVRAALDKTWRELVPGLAVGGLAGICANAYRRAKAAKSAPSS